MIDGTEWAPSGKVVQVTTKRHGDAEPLIERYFVAIDTDVEAIELTRNTSGSSSDTSIEIVGFLTQNQMKALQMPRWSIRPVD